MGSTRLEMDEIKVADVRAQVFLSLRTDFENSATLKPHESHIQEVHAMADDLIPRAKARQALRNGVIKRGRKAA